MPSHAANERYWVATRDQIMALRLKDFLIQKMEPTRDQKVVWNLLTGLYPQYCKAVENLGIVLDEMCQIQRRLTVQKLFNAANIRLTELRRDLCQLDLAEIIYIDNTLIAQKLIPQDIDIIVPGHIAHESRNPAMQELLDKIAAGERVYTAPVPEVEEVVEQVVEEKPKRRIVMDDDEDEEPRVPVEILPHENPKISPAKRAELLAIYLYNQTIGIIQRAIRAHTGRLVVQATRQLQALKASGQRPKKALEAAVLLPHVQLIQRVWRGYRVRKLLKIEEVERQILIGMLIPSWKSNENTETLAKNQERRRELKRHYQAEAAAFREKERTRVLAVRAENLFEDITDEIIQWFSEWYVRTGTFDMFPEAEDGGTLLVVTGQTKSLKEWEAEEAHRLWLIERYLQSPDLKKKDAEDAARLKAEEKERKKAQRIRDKEEAAAEKANPNPLWKFAQTPGLIAMKEANREYLRDWGFTDPADNPFQETYNERITEELYAELGQKLRVEADALMRVELQLLREAVNRDRAKLGLGPAPVAKPPKKKKKKVPKDPTAHRTIEDLFQELVDVGIIRKYPYTTLDDFIGDYNLSAWDLRQKILDPPPCLADIKHVLLTSCILPMASQEAARPVGVLLAGPRGCGKKKLVNAVCTHTGAVMFDISPNVTVGKYPGSKGLKLLIHMLGKVAKIMQPSIFFMNGGEKPFYLKVPATEAANDPKLLKKDLFKGIAKCAGPTDLVMFIATSNEPWNATPGPMLKCFERIILMGPLDYGSLLLIWQKAIFKFHGVRRDFDCSSLARLTVGYPYRFLMDCLDVVMTPDRVIRLCYQPLKGEEILRVIVAGGVAPVNKDEYQKYIDWYNKTRLGTRKLQRIERIRYEMILEAKLAAKAAKK